MKIKDLIIQLQKYPEEQEIYISGDPEGNDIRTIHEIDVTDLNTEDDPNETDIRVIIWPTDEIIN